MTLYFESNQAIEYMAQYFGHNKARGMVAEIAFGDFLKAEHTTAVSKYFEGAWIVSPKVENSLQYRYAIFVLPRLFEDEQIVTQAIHHLEQNRGQQALYTFLHHNGVGVIIVGAISPSANPQEIEWVSFGYQAERLIRYPTAEPFASWPRGRGRANLNHKVWAKDVLGRFESVSDDNLTAMTLRQAFFYGYLKKQLKIPLDDPYDVDGFVISYLGHTLPLEIKEKSATKEGKFGIDAGRILMMLRFCLASNKNAVYIIREVDDSMERNLIDWRYITLSDMVMGASWNLQAGGMGMGGGATQTVMLSGSLFSTFTADTLSEDWFAQNAHLQESAKARAQTFATGLSKYL